MKSGKTKNALILFTSFQDCWKHRLSSECVTALILFTYDHWNPYVSTWNFRSMKNVPTTIVLHQLGGVEVGIPLKNVVFHHKMLICICDDYGGPRLQVVYSSQMLENCLKPH